MQIESDKIEILIKWNKESIIVTLNSWETLDELRVKIYSMIQVQPDKQKIIFKGKVLKDLETTLKGLGITNVC